MVSVDPWLIAASLGLLNIAVTVYVLVCKVAVRFSALEVKVATMWDFLLKRAVAEAVTKGIATTGSPLELTEQARQALAPISADLKRWYARKGRHLSYPDLLLALERDFGAWLVRHVCVPLGVTDGACLIAAATLCGARNPS